MKSGEGEAFWREATEKESWRPQSQCTRCFRGRESRSFPLLKHRGCRAGRELCAWRGVVCGEEPDSP